MANLFPKQSYLISSELPLTYSPYPEVIKCRFLIIAKAATSLSGIDLDLH